MAIQTFQLPSEYLIEAAKKDMVSAERMYNILKQNVEYGIEDKEHIANFLKDFKTHMKEAYDIDFMSEQDEIHFEDYLFELKESQINREHLDGLEEIEQSVLETDFNVAQSENDFLNVSDKMCKDIIANAKTDNEYVDEARQVFEKYSKFDNLKTYSAEEQEMAIFTVKELLKNNHPIRYIVTETTNRFKEVLGEVTKGRHAYQIAGDAFKSSVRKAYDYGEATVGNASIAFQAMQSSVDEARRDACRNLAICYQKAGDKYLSLLSHAKESCMNIAYAARKVIDKTFDAVTLGAYSIVQEKLAVDNFKKMDVCTAKMKELREQVKNLREQMVENPCDGTKNMYKECKEELRLAQIEYTARKAANIMHPYKNAEEAKNYYEELSENAFFWGKLEDETFRRPPVKAMKDTIVKAVKNIEKGMTSVSNKMKFAALSTKVASYDTQASIALGLKETYDKQESRITKKIQAISDVDVEISKLQGDLEKIIHQLTQFTPFVRAEYQPSPELLRCQNILKSMNPTKENLEMVRTLEKQLVSEKKSFEKEQDKLEDKAAQEYISLLEDRSTIELKIDRLLDKKENSDKKLEILQRKLDETETHKDNIISFLQENDDKKTQAVAEMDQI